MSAVAIRQTRAESVAEYRALIAQGLSIAEIAEREGKAYTSVANLLADPDGSKQRRRRERYRGRCIDCGAPTDGSNGKRNAPKRCASCAAEHQHAEQYWTAERVIEAIQRWAAEHGHPPKAMEWPRVAPDRAHPVFTSCYRNPGSPNAPFARWADAIEAAGFPRPNSGSRLDPETWRRNLIAAHRRLHGFARDYGEVVHIGAEIGVGQRRALRARSELGLSEHIRRAIDLYLEEQAASTDGEATSTTESAEASA